MSMYQPTIPTGLVPLNQDYANLRDNFTQINTTYNTDHVPLTDNTTQNGHHSVIHLAKQSPGTVGISNTFSLYDEQTNDGYGNKQQLFAISGSAAAYELTRNFNPSVDGSGNGSTFLPGGFVLQWGEATKNTGETVTFPRPFITAVYSIQTTVFDSGTSRVFVWVQSSSVTDFTVASRDSSGQDVALSFFWVAIGK